MQWTFRRSLLEIHKIFKKLFPFVSFYYGCYVVFALILVVPWNYVQYVPISVGDIGQQWSIAPALDIIPLIFSIALIVLARIASRTRGAEQTKVLTSQEVSKHHFLRAGRSDLRTLFLCGVWQCWSWISSQFQRNQILNGKNRFKGSNLTASCKYYFSGWPYKKNV